MNHCAGNKARKTFSYPDVLFLKKYLLQGFESARDYIAAISITIISMKPTIMPGSIVLIDRKDVQPRAGRAKS